MSDTTFADLGQILVIIPTFNELESLPVIIGRVRASVPEAFILVADDNSPDGTGKLADKLATEDDHIKVMHRLGKEGLGAAYLAGFAWALEYGYDVIVEMDADGSHQPEQLPRQEVSLLLQKPWAIDDNKIAGAQKRLEAGLTSIPERNRFYHRDHVGMYLPGRHRSFHPASTRRNPNVLVVHFRYSPWNAQLLQRKLQILDRVDPKDLARGWGVQHASKADQLERERQNVIPLAEDLREHPIASRSEAFKIP